MDEIIKYFTEEKKETPVVARILEKPLVKYDENMGIHPLLGSTIRRKYMNSIRNWMHREFINSS